jgi:hypothetical protein
MYVGKETCCTTIHAYKLCKFYMSITCYVQGRIYKGAVVRPSRES